MLTIEETAAILKLMGDKTRLTMLKLLEGDSCCVCEFVELFGMSQPAISQHLRKLKDVGLIKENKRHQWVFYNLNTDHPLYPLVVRILESVPSQQEKLLRLTEDGKRIDCC
ncbi:HTH-type transcriptional repressor AseR [Halolactibacillus alkaliphilus]|uniref:HTH-type transcriptional repressor AseR n=1 Tax=Halolactibacillus alkaliphilus TaxID=442899 RepID=A0A511X1D1_9BACI|nr:metalloregulator ArsR/SmtB family transcription factor [Halolactibacillus alkaliphilus]GEN56757.1 HTH-type transcriptional repressor AseR [Halolactibacillus alkaliphilus]GGN70818.1 HTH-type transcriptional repressor AseR [Halolactibacillus alkaliphilus]